MTKPFKIEQRKAKKSANKTKKFKIEKNEKILNREKI